MGTLNKIKKIFHQTQETFRRKGANILVYHYVGEKNEHVNKLGISVSVKLFRNQIKYLKQNFKIVPFSQLAKCMWDKKILAITFDDGYKSVIDEALPILEEYECPFKLYLNNSQVHGEMGWLNKLSVLHNHLSAEEMHKFSCRAFEGDDNVEWKYVHNQWSRFIPEKTTKVIDEAYRDLNVNPDRDLYINVSEIRKYKNHNLIEWGAHGANHYPLDRLDNSQMYDEIIGGYKGLQELLDDRLQGFALPFGVPRYRTNRIAEVVSQVDKQFVTATNQPITNSFVGNMREISRISMHPTAKYLNKIFSNNKSLIEHNP